MRARIKLRLGWLVGALLIAAPGVGLAAAAEPTGEGGAAPALSSGSDLFLEGRFEEAADAWAEAARDLAAEGDTQGQVAALLRVATARQAQGRYQEALRTLAGALELAKEKGDTGHLAALYAAIGTAYVALGPPELARRHLDGALELARGGDAPALEAAILNNLGNLQASEGALAEAAHAYAQSAERAEAAGDAALAARAYANAARVALRAGDPPARVRDLLAKARASAETLPDSHDKATLLINVGRSYERLHQGAGASGEASTRDLERAQQVLRRAEEAAGSVGDGLALSYALGYQGALYEARGRRDEAFTLTRRALFLAQQANAPGALYRWHWQLGRLERAEGDVPAALVSYREAVDVLQSIRSEMTHGYATGEGFREAVGPVYFELVDLLLASAPDPQQKAAFQARLLQAREVVEEFKAAELRDYFQDECVDAQQAKVESLDQVSPKAVVIYPVMLADRLELLLTLPGGMQRATVPIGADELTQEVRRLRYFLEKRTTLEYLPYAQRLYDVLVRPFEAELANPGIETLVFVPDGPLRTIPMAALHDGSHFLVERFALATTPGLSLTDPRPLDRAHLKVFLSGLSDPVQGYPPLEYVPTELAAIHDLYGGDVLLNQDFELEKVEKTLTEHEFNVVHIASHGEFAGDAEDSFLLTYDGRLTLDQLADYVGRYRFRETPIELLTLSACETAEGNDRAALGLAGVAVRAGARSALGTLWSVNDAASAQLVTEFYQQLHDDSVSKATALRRAQLELEESGTYAHPFYWSPFLLISNWL
jgi:CHAT domain-containing protein